MHGILQQQQGLYLYFGHGAGESFFSRGDIDDFASKNSNSWRCSAVVLMGCSSGELKTVNGQYGAMSGNPIHFEPEGVALSYLCAGAPCVVANLWDVTDYDIDRFSISFLKGLFRGSRMTLGQSVTSSRDACKLKFLVGTAPIIYGIPVTIRDTTRHNLE
jgi:separase